MKRLLLALVLLSLTATTAHAGVTIAVLDEQGKPLAGARVRAFAHEDQAVFYKRLLSKAPETSPVATVTTAADGRASLDVKGEERVLLVVDAAGRAVQRVEAFEGRDAGPVVLPQAAPRKGRVTSGGQGVANALVAAGQWYVTHTDAQGGYEVPALAEGSETLNVLHPDYAIAQGSISPSESRNQSRTDVELRKGVTVKGRVLAADGKTPVPHAVVSVFGWPLAESDEIGNYSIAHTIASRVVAARTPGRAGMAIRRGTATDIRLAPSLSLSGVVRSGTAPVAGVVVTLFDQADSTASPATFSDGRGRFAFDGLRAGEYSLFGAHPDYDVQELGAVSLPAAGECVLTAEPLVLVAGHVVDEARRPVAGARLFNRLVGPPSRPFSGNSYTANSTTSATGEFRAHFPPGGGVQFLAIKRGYAVAVVEPVWVDEADNITIKLPSGFSATIRVIDHDGEPVQGAEIRILPGNHGPHDFLELPCSDAREDCRTTNAAGKLTERLVEGKYDFQLSGEEIVPQLVSGQLLTARSPAVTVTVERKAVVSGRVLYDDGTPVAGAMVTGSIARTAISAADGTFTLRGLVSGSTSMSAYSNTSPSFSRGNVPVTAPSKNVVLRIPMTTAISGRVTEKITGKPVVDFEIGTPDGSAAFHSDDGTFVIQARPGSTELHVKAAGYVRTIVSGLVVEEGKPLSGVEVQLERAGVVVGRVTSGGKPLAYADLRAYAGSPAALTGVATTTDYDGNYVLEDVKPGVLTVIARRERWLTKEKAIIAKAGEDVQADLELEQGRELSGRVIDRDCHPVRSANIEIRDAQPAIYARAVTNAEGTFKASGLPDGPLSLSAGHSGFVPTTINDVDPAKNVTVTLDRGGMITGRITGLSAAEMASVHVHVSESLAGAGVGSDGSFAVSGLRDGTFSVTAVKTGLQTRTSAPKRVTVTNGTAPGIEFDFSKGITVSGHAMRWEGKPVSAGWVRFHGTKGQPDESAKLAPDGAYEISGLQPGEYEVFVSLQGVDRESKVPNVTVAGSMTRDLVITGRRLSGRVVDAATGEPLSLTTVGLRRGLTGGGPRRSVTKADGRFSIELLDDGPYELTTERYEYAMLRQALDLPNHDLDLGDLRIEAPAPTRVRTLDGITGQIMTARVTVKDPVTGELVAESSSSPGIDARLFLAKGRYKITVAASGYGGVTGEIIVPSPEFVVHLMPEGRQTTKERTP